MIEAPSLEDIEAAQDRLDGLVVRTPLVPLRRVQAAGSSEEAETVGDGIYLKLENLQPIGSFKLRGAGNALRSVDPDELRDGVYTASAGNMAQGVAWVAREMGVRCSVVVPDHAPKTKLDAVEQLGGEVIRVPFDDWWRVIQEHSYSGLPGLFLHPVSDRRVIAGNGTIGLEIIEDLPGVDAVVVPFGGGGLVSGIATAMRARRSGVGVYAAEVETAAPLAPSLAAGRPVTVDYTPSFVDGIGSTRPLDEMWPLVRASVDESIVCSLDAVASALRLLIEGNRVVAEGAGAAALAAGLRLAGREVEATPRKIVCVVSGGNIDLDKLTAILEGRPTTSRN